MNPLIIKSSQTYRTVSRYTHLITLIKKIFDLIPEDTSKLSEITISKIDAGVYVDIYSNIFYKDEVMAHIGKINKKPPRAIKDKVRYPFEIEIQAYSDPETEDEFLSLVKKHPKKFFNHEVRYYFGEDTIIKTIEIPEEIKTNKKPLDYYPLYLSNITPGDVAYIQRIIDFALYRLEEYWKVQTEINR